MNRAKECLRQWRLRVIRSRSRTEREEGSALVLLLCGMPLFLVCAALVLDGGAAINGVQRADDTSDQAARVAADQLDLSDWRSAVGSTDGAALSRAQTSACEYVQVALPGATCSIAITTGHVDVAVSSQVPTQFFGMIGIHEFTVHGKGSADAVTGVEQGATP